MSSSLIVESIEGELPAFRIYDPATSPYVPPYMEPTASAIEGRCLVWSNVGLSWIALSSSYLSSKTSKTWEGVVKEGKQRRKASLVIK
jgi:hypothetical protein